MNETFSSTVGRMIRMGAHAYAHDHGHNFEPPILKRTWKDKLTSSSIFRLDKGYSILYVLDDYTYQFARKRYSRKMKAFLYELFLSGIRIVAQRECPENLQFWEKEAEMDGEKWLAFREFQQGE
jgi:hypothetical protein